MRLKAPLFRRSASVALVAGAAFCANGADAETRQTLDVSLSGRAVTNPYLDSANDSLVASGTIAIDPRISFSDEITDFVINGDFRFDQYTNGEGSDESLAVGAAAQTRLSERAVLSVGANATSTRSGALDVLQLGAPPSLDASQQISPDVVVPDISAVGHRARLNRYSAHAGLALVLTPHSNINFGANGGYSNSHETGGQDYSYGNLTLAYDQALSERTSLLATLNAGAANYSGVSFRDAKYVTPLLGIKSALGQQTKLTLEAGATFTRFAGGENHVDFAANVNICRNGEHYVLCAVASRDSSPTAYEGVSTFTSAGLSYSLQPSTVERVTVGVHYGKTDGVSNLATALKRSSRVLGASAEYSRAIGKRTFAFIRPSVSQDRSTNLGGSFSDTSIQLEIGVRARFGDLG